MLPACWPQNLRSSVRPGQLHLPAAHDLANLRDGNTGNLSRHAPIRARREQQLVLLTAVQNKIDIFIARKNNFTRCFGLCQGTASQAAEKVEEKAGSGSAALQRRVRR